MAEKTISEWADEMIKAASDQSRLMQLIKELPAGIAKEVANTLYGMPGQDAEMIADLIEIQELGRPKENT